MTRGEFVNELLVLWEEGATKMHKTGHFMVEMQLRTAVDVLKYTYSAMELMTPPVDAISHVCSNIEHLHQHRSPAKWQEP